MKNLTDSNRLVQYDLLKGFGILLVLWGHINCPPMVKIIIYGFHMPLFFFVSGCFYKPSTSFVLFTKKKIRQLLLPWSFFASILFLLKASLVLYETHDIRMAILSSFNDIYKGLLGCEDSYIFYQTIWFLIALFEVSVLYHLLFKRINNVLAITLLSVVFYLLGFELSNNQINFPYFIDTVLSVFIYYHCGYCFRKFDYDNKKIPIITIMMGLLLSLLLVYALSPKIDIKTNIFPWYLVFLSLPIIICMYFLLNKIKSLNLRWIEYCGTNSLLLLGFHRPMFDILVIVYNKLDLPIRFIGIPVCYLWGIFWVIVSATIIILLSKYINKYFAFWIRK